MVLMQQWDFLKFVTEQANRYPTFHLKMETEFTALIEDEGRIVGVRATFPDGPIEIRADLVVTADGRSSVLRESVLFRSSAAATSL
jgi:2-polyprenyl-6-methoxyphenol hydroxylase-like FAD-dependent oxidoreductase